MAVAFRVGLRQRPPEKKGKEGRVCGQPVPSLVPLHEQTAAKPRHPSPPALGFSAETDSLLEGTGFEPSVPREASAFSSPVRADFSGGGKSSGGNMSRSRNLDRVTRYQWFESGFLQRGVVQNHRFLRRWKAPGSG